MDWPQDGERELGRISGGLLSAGGDQPLLHLGPYIFKWAETDLELDQVHRLNYEVFVREVAQYSDSGTGYLVDKFHLKNTYLIATLRGDVVGMVAAHDRPPFSLADRLADPIELDRPGETPLEVPLLAVRAGYRRGPVFSGLLWSLREHARRFARAIH